MTAAKCYVPLVGALCCVLNLVFNQKLASAVIQKQSFVKATTTAYINISIEPQMIDDLINEILALHGNQSKRMMTTKGKAAQRRDGLEDELMLHL